MTKVTVRGIRQNGAMGRDSYYSTLMKYGYKPDAQQEAA